MQCITYEQMGLIYDIRMFWYELFTWTRAYMLSRYRGIGNVDAVKARLNQVPAEFIDALQQVFGLNLEAYLEILNTYINLIDDLITAQQAGNASLTGRLSYSNTLGYKRMADQVI